MIFYIDQSILTLLTLTDPIDSNPIDSTDHHSPVPLSDRQFERHDIGMQSRQTF